jgi:hypothetical protein
MVKSFIKCRVSQKTAAETIDFLFEQKIIHDRDVLKYYVREKYSEQRKSTNKKGYEIIQDIAAELRMTDTNVETIIYRK